MVFVPAVSTFVISKMLGDGEMLIGDIIESQFFGATYNPYLGAALSLVLMVLVLVCMAVMNLFNNDDEEAVII
jgi:spermidine/putrescine transport system permease protein